MHRTLSTFGAAGASSFGPFLDVHSGFGHREKITLHFAVCSCLTGSKLRAWKGDSHAQKDRFCSGANHFQRAGRESPSGPACGSITGWRCASLTCSTRRSPRGRETLENVKIRSCLTMRPRAVVDGDPDGKHFFWFSWHFSGYDRKKHDAGRCNYMPVNLGEVPDYYRRFLDSGGHRHSEDMPDGRGRLLQLQRRQSLAPRRD